MPTALESTSLTGDVSAETLSTHAEADEGATLSALIRDACQRRERRGFGVRVGAREGHVFVADGRVVHAELGRQDGLRAVLEMLDAEGLSIQQSTRAFPPRPSLSLDPSELGPGPSARSGVRPAAEMLPPPVHEPHRQPLRPSLPPPPRTPLMHRPTLPAPSFEKRPRLPAFAASPERQPRGVELTMIRLSRTGALVAARGSRSERLANVAALLHHTASLIGADLGHSARPSLCLEGRGQSLLVLSSRQRGVCAALGATSQLEDLSRKAGLS